MKHHLSPEEMFPAGETGYRVRNLPLRDGSNVRIVERGDENARPLLLVHGWACSAFAFYRNVPELSDKGYRVIVPDLKGHGLSDKPVSAEEYSTIRMVDHLESIADSLGLKRFALGGHSLGAALALRFAIANPDRIECLALISPVGTSGLSFHSLIRAITPRWSLPAWRILATRWMTRIFLWLAHGRLAAPTEMEVDEYWAPSQFPAFLVALRHLLHELDWGPIKVEGLDSRKIPTLLMSGSRDHLCRSGTRKHLQQELGCAPDVVKGAGHVLISEGAPQVNSALLQLLAQSH